MKIGFAFNYSGTLTNYAQTTLMSQREDRNSQYITRLFLTKRFEMT